MNQLANAREKTSADPGNRKHASREQHFIARLGLTVSGQPAPNCPQFAQPRSHPEAQLMKMLDDTVVFSLVEGIAIDQFH